MISMPSTTISRTHWHAGHNMAGYLPDMTTEPDAYSTFDAARDALITDLEWERDTEYDDTPGKVRAAQLAGTLAALREADGSSFCEYTCTHADSAHDIDTAWWVVACTMPDCEPADDGPAHAGYPHEAGRLYGCPACEAECFCGDLD